MLGSAGLGLLPALLTGQVPGKGKVTAIQLPESPQHIRHGLFEPIERAKFAAGPSWLTHFRRDHFLGNGFGQAAADMVHFTLGIGGQAMGITLRGNRAFVSEGDSRAPLAIDLPRQGTVRLLKSRNYEAWVISGKGKLPFPENKASEAFLASAGEVVWLNGYKGGPAQGLWGRGIGQVEVKHASEGCSILVLKFA